MKVLIAVLSLISTGSSWADSQKQYIEHYKIKSVVGPIYHPKGQGSKELTKLYFLEVVPVNSVIVEGDLVNWGKAEEASSNLPYRVIEVFCENQDGNYPEIIPSDGHSKHALYGPKFEWSKVTCETISKKIGPIKASIKKKEYNDVALNYAKGTMDIFYGGNGTATLIETAK